jgi:presenilin-like A22 family membrane protease
MLGIMGGFACLMVLVMKGKPQAGLPLLNTGAILGYIISYVIIYGNLSLGFALWW